MTSTDLPDPSGVLVVEDEALVRMLVVQTLEDAGFEVTEAEEAVGALAALRADPRIRLVVTDLGLPGLDGRRLADRARAERPGIKVLFMTGYATDIVLADLAPTEGCDLIAKPFTLDDLTARAKALLGP